MYFDFVIKYLRVIIELDGIQHFVQVHKWKSPEEQRKADKHKLILARDNKYSMIRIFQKDVWDDKNDWQQKLLTEISKHPRIKPTLTFIGNYTKEYKDFVSENY